MVAALAALEDAFARSSRGQGPIDGPASGPVIGYVGADVPVELLTAAGFHAVRLTGDPGADSVLGDRYLGRGVDPMARSILTRLLNGAYGELDRVVVGHDCEASLRLFYALRELRRVEPGAGVPEPYLVDILHLPHRTTARYNHRRIGEFAARLAAWTGRPPALAAPDLAEPDLAASRLAVAIAAHDERRRLLAAVAGLRRSSPARLTGAQFLAAANAPLPPAEHVRLLRELLAQADGLPERHGRRVFLSGSDHDTAHVYRAIEADGHVIVGEDHSFGDPQAERLVGGGGLDALAEHYHEYGPTAHRATTAERAAHAAVAARRCGAELFVAYARTGDDAPAWDFPAQRAALDIPAVLLDRQDYGHADLAALHKADLAAPREEDA
ncbi:2-hydroxyacyl-CoA dehydratase [Nonomuraea sp. PA05]|uniref:2-hydroxyacyl-CoA dehydratase family protein n=1 Tax=Nonomuraea sp. PA05 TaxID=2604466 RepID=UPI0011DA8B44|nr:2-hydroxyacyl-CoA dehydratase family protein [Nonomuraea sp. PA05]TYB57394.1 2-hydroxyacyl-CoA dehydratase [Nonomuraea sp. PA05]